MAPSGKPFSIRLKISAVTWLSLACSRKRTNVRGSERFFLDLHYARTFLKTKTTLNSGQTIDTRLDPDIYTLSVGMRF